jgi:hypothetical protein
LVLIDRTTPSHFARRMAFAGFAQAPIFLVYEVLMRRACVGLRHADANGAARPSAVL